MRTSFKTPSNDSANLFSSDTNNKTPDTPKGTPGVIPVEATFDPHHWTSWLAHETERERYSLESFILSAR